MKKFFAAKILVPVSVVLIAIVVSTMFFLFISLRDVSKDAEKENAKASISQFKILRGYYTKNVISKVKQHTDLKINFDHARKEETIPLPATMIHDLSQLFNNSMNGKQLKLYSDYPFPNRANRQLDEFARQALSYLKQNPDKEFVRSEVLNGQHVVRVAISDKMVDPACVNCHNTRPDTPKNNWQMGDVRGVLEFINPIERQLNATSAILEEAFWIFIISFLIGIILLGYFITFFVRSSINKINEITTSVNKGDLTIHDSITHQKDEFGEITKAFQTLVKTLRSNVMNVGETANKVKNSSERVNDTASQLSEGSKAQASSIEQISSSMEEMGSNIQQNTDNANQTEKIARKAADDANTSGQTVTETVQAMSEIASKISIIEEIARQTNLLALNAAIEAARAGEHGKGFAVVASEVRKLAERSQSAAGEINELAVNSVEVAENAGKMLNALVPDIEKTAELVQEISAASREQNSGVQQINSAIDQLDRVMQKNAAFSEHLASSSAEMGTMATELTQAVNIYKTGMPSDGYDERRKASARLPQSTSAPKPMAPPAAPSTPPAAKAITHVPSRPNQGINLEMGQGGTDAMDDEFEKF